MKQGVTSAGARTKHAGSALKRGLSRKSVKNRACIQCVFCPHVGTNHLTNARGPHWAGGKKQTAGSDPQRGGAYRYVGASGRHPALNTPLRPARGSCAPPPAGLRKWKRLSRPRSAGSPQLRLEEFPLNPLPTLTTTASPILGFFFSFFFFFNFCFDSHPTP